MANRSMYLSDIKISVDLVYLRSDIMFGQTVCRKRDVGLIFSPASDGAAIQLDQARRYSSERGSGTTLMRAAEAREYNQFLTR